MTRRPVLPGASELFRRTDTTAAASEVTELPSMPTPATSPSLRGAGAARRTADTTDGAMPLTLVPGGAGDDDLAGFRDAAVGQAAAPVLQPRIATRGRPARNAQRTKHDEKITVYISADELLALETARLVLRAQHGLAADRGRIVREAIAVLLTDLTERGEDSVLVRRLKEK